MNREKRVMSIRGPIAAFFVFFTIMSVFVQAATVDLEKLKANYVAQNDDVLTGTLTGNYKISIVDGASVTLDGVTINGKNDEMYSWAGITCEGDCEIVLAKNSVNTVKGFFENYPGISVPRNGVLTISGSGSLDASSNGFGAGIGGAYQTSCGDIVINGGDVKATGYGSAAGIGGSLYGTVGNITITDGVTRVIAVKGEYAPNSIGGGREADGVGAVTIAGVVVDGVAASPFEFSPDKIFEVVFDKNGGEGTMDKQKLVYGLRAPLSLNAFTRKEHSFTGWNTKSDGSGFAFADGDRDLSLDAASGAVTLYAQWIENKANVVNLQTLSENTSVPNGVTLTGTLSGEYKISIEDGAKVILNGVNINGVNSSDYKWAGITCEGDCEIVLAENSVNNVKGFYDEYPGIYVPMGKTLTISGSGALNASSNGWGAGIGSGYEGTAGNIVISGGSVSATGFDYAAGIGGGGKGTVGDIMITDGVTKVVAVKGKYAPNSIGEGYDGAKSGTITIAEIVVENVPVSPFEYSPDNKDNFYTVVYDANSGEGSMPAQKFIYDLSSSLSTNVFKRKGHFFIGWNTEKNGSGKSYEDGVAVVNLADQVSKTVTLYAQWSDGNISKLNGDYVAEDGDVLTGTLTSNYKISIADGATVTLNGVTIIGLNKEEYKWAGISCLGDCNIVLAENSVNTVKGFHEDYPGIHVPEGKTLVISGSGELHVRSSGKGAGIGGGYNINSGNIVISSGTIKATGGSSGAGIGGGEYGTVGNITISGGTITAEGGPDASGIGGAYRTNGGDIEISGGTIMATGGLYAAGIGSGTEGVVGNITITADVAKVTATKGKEVAPNSVGGGHNASKIGTITIGGDVKTDGVKEATYVYPRTDYVAVQIRECDGRTCAIIDADYDGNEGPVSVPEAVKVDSIVYNRNLTPLTPATTVLPFTLPAGTTYNAKFYKLDVVKDQNCSWKASMSNIGDELPQANEPYAVILNKGEMLLKFNMPKGEKAILQTKEIDDQTEENGKWIFRGVYSFKIWQSGDDELDLGLAYAFAGSNKAGVPKGTFGRVGEGTYATPMRAYLRKINENVRLTSCPAAVSARGAASYSVSSGLPEIIDVEFVDENKKTTAIGRLNTVTGEIRIDKWFDLKGRSVGNKANKARGAYYGKIMK